MKNGTLRVGLVGCGAIAQTKHLPSLAKLPHLCEIAGFCDADAARRESSRTKYGCADARTYAEYQDLLADPSIDVVHVLTPNAYHASVTVAALDAGKHVLCEKPMAETSADAWRMVEAARRNRRKLTIGYQTRFRDDVVALRKAVESGFLGDIYYARAHAVRRRGVPTWLLRPSATGFGGPLVDIGTHALDLTLWMMGNYEPASVTGSVFWKLNDQPEGNPFGEWAPGQYQVEDSAFGFVKMKNGATVSLETSWALNTTENQEASTTLCGTKGGAEIRGGLATPYRLVLNRVAHGMLVEETITGAGKYTEYTGNIETLAEVMADPGLHEAEQWLRAILEDRDPSVLPEQAYVVTRILEAVYESHRTGKTVAFA